MKTAFLFIKAIIVLLLLAGVAGAEESCRPWTTPGADATKGRYSLSLRVCDLTYGLSAYIEIKNESNTRLAVGYRIVTNDDKSRDTEIILAPATTTRAENCQACAKRHSGFKSWEILTVSEVVDDQAGTAVAAPLPAFMDSTVAEKKPATSNPESKIPVQPAPAAVVEKPAAPEPKPATISAVPAAPVATSTSPAVTTPSAKAPVAKTVSTSTEASKNEATEEGFHAEDGTIIPWEKMPPEFRPRK